MEDTTTSHPLADVIEAVVEGHNRMWATGVIEPGSALRDVEGTLTAVQYAPHFENGVWHADSGHEWLEGTAQAGAALVGQGCTWSVHDLNILARSDREAIASYRIVHSWGDGDRRPAQAFFLETWRRGDDGTWRLARHTAEKT